MIKIDRIPAPVELTPEIVAQKTAAFKANHNLAVWREPYIIRRLLEMSHSKCSYCECSIDEESKYMEVEHFHHKDKYEDEVVAWDNLLPSCKSCNVQKRDHDTIINPIIDPTKQNPRDHLVFFNFFLRGKTNLGVMTEVTLDLNNYKQHCLPRFKISSQLTSTVGDIYNRAQEVTIHSSAVTKTRLRNKVIELLQLCQPNEPYTAIKTTTILNDKKYMAIVQKLKAIDMWNEPLVTFDATMRMYQLDIE